MKERIVAGWQELVDSLKKAVKRNRRPAQIRLSAGPRGGSGRLVPAPAYAPARRR